MQIQNPMMFVRSIKGASSSILWVLVLVRQALTVRQLCTYTDYKPDTVREALDVLAGYEMVRETRRAHGEALYSLGEGYQFLLPGIDPVAMGKVLQMVEPESEKIGFCEAQGRVIDMTDEIQSPKKSDSGEEGGQKTPKSDEKCDQSPKKSDSEPGKTGSIMIEEEELINYKLINPHQSEPGEKFPADLKTVLENLYLIDAFDDILSVDEVPRGTKAEVAFAWVCKINADIARGGQIHTPVGLLRKRLATGSKRKILHQDLLPVAYLRALGFVIDEKLPPFSEEALARAVETARAEQAAAEAEEREIADRLNRAVSHEIAQAWHNILAELREEMPKATFDTWVGDTRPVGWQNQTLVIAARNTYAADWLTTKLAARINKLLDEHLPGVIEFTTVDKFLEANND